MERSEFTGGPLVTLGGNVSYTEPAIYLGGPNIPNYTTSVVGGGDAAFLAPNGLITASSELLALAVVLPIRPDGGNDWIVYWPGSTGLSSNGYDPSTGILFISGQASASVYQTVLRTIYYRDASTIPNTTDRVIGFITSDGVNTSTPVTATVHVLASGKVSTNTFITLPPQITVGDTSARAIVSVTATDGSIPTGQVSMSYTGPWPNSGVPFYHDLVNGQSSYTLDSLPVGTYQLTASYYGDGRCQPSTNNTTLVVSPFISDKYYVAEAGDDGKGDGSFSRPWKTIGRVNLAIMGIPFGVSNARIRPGDTIHFHRGEPFPGNLLFPVVGGAAGAPITIKDYGDNPAPPKIEAQNGYPGIIIVGTDTNPVGYFNIVNLQIQARDGSGILAWNTGNVLVSDLEIDGSYDGTEGSKSDGNGIEFINTSQTSLSNITVQGVTIQRFGQALKSTYLQGLGGSGHGILISSLNPLPYILYRAGGLAGKPLGGGYENITIGPSKLNPKTDISYSTRAGIEITGPGPGIYKSGSPNPIVFRHLRIDHVDMHNIAAASPNSPAWPGVGYGLNLVAVEDGIVEKCRAHENGTEAFINTGVGFFAQFSNHILFQYNEAHHNQSAAGGDEGGFDFDRFTTNSIMQFNYSHDNDGWGFMLGSSGINGRGQMPAENNVIRFNISMNDCRKSDYGALLFENWSASNIDVYNNTFYMRENGFLTPNGQPDPAAAIRFRIDENQKTLVPPTIHLYNNILFTQDNSVPLIKVDNSFDTTSVRSLGNAYNSVNIIFNDAKAVYDDPNLGFESNQAVAPPISNIDKMAMDLMPFFQLNVFMTAPMSIRQDGVDLRSEIRSNWWTPDNFFWDGQIGIARDFFGVGVPQGFFSIGASQSTR